MIISFIPLGSSFDHMNTLKKNILYYTTKVVGTLAASTFAENLQGAVFKRVVKLLGSGKSSVAIGCMVHAIERFRYLLH